MTASVQTLIPILQWHKESLPFITIEPLVYVITPKVVTPRFELGSYPVAGYALTAELYDLCSLEAWADTNTPPRPGLH